MQGLGAEVVLDQVAQQGLALHQGLGVVETSGGHVEQRLPGDHRQAIVGRGAEHGAAIDDIAVARLGRDRRLGITTPNNQAIALGAATGKELWRYKRRPSPRNCSSCTRPTVASRCMAIVLISATTDANLVALKAPTGKELWRTQVADWRKGYDMTLAPLAAKGKIMIGSSGGEYGIRGFVAAFDAETGKEAWRTYTMPARGEPGGDPLLEDTDKRGGGSVWITGTYDADTNIAYWGRRQRRAVDGRYLRRRQPVCQLDHRPRCFVHDVL